MKVDKLIVLGAMGLVFGIGYHQAIPANAARRPSILRVVSEEANVVQYKVTNGVIYKDSSLTKVKAKANDYSDRVFYSNETITVKRPNGKRAIYRTLSNRYGKDWGFIWHGYATKIKDLSWNFGDFDAPTKDSDNEKKYFDASELQQINQIRTQASAINNDTKNIYAIKPTLSGEFNPGKLNDTYIQGTIDWINLYRSMYGLSSVTDNPDWNVEAQYGAATLAAADEGLSHGLVGINKPSNISEDDWDRGADATNSSNLANGLVSPEGNVTEYLNDEDNDIPGHRDWLLGRITQVGVGQAADYNDLKVFDRENYQPNTPASAIEFPNSGVFPYEAASETRWSLSIPQEISSNDTPSITVYDNTAKKSISVSDISVDNKKYGNFGTTVSYDPDENQIKLNHSYTISISGLSGQPDTSYTTKLFSIDRDQAEIN